MDPRCWCDNGDVYCGVDKAGCENEISRWKSDYIYIYYIYIYYIYIYYYNF
jgi:hypothetical protein